MMGDATDIELAMEVFARGFAFTRSATHPCLAERVAGMWVIRDGERKNGRGYRREEWVAHGLAAAEVDASARAGTRGRFCICAIRTPGEPDGPMRMAYKSAGYRLGTTEPFMMHRMGKIPRLAEPLPIERVVTPELAAAYGKAVKRQPLSAESYAPDSPRQTFVALDKDVPVGWVTSIGIADSAWVHNMHVRPTHRRRGIGKSLLAHMLREAKRRGLRRSVLLASHTGALLYPTVGYEQIGELLLFTPRKNR
jgi:GNAT superfamily N-acetyltransferase